MKKILSVCLVALSVFAFYTVAGCKQTPKEVTKEASAIIAQVERDGGQTGSASSTLISKDDGQMLDALNRSLAAVSEAVKPSIVNISTTTTVSMKQSPFGDLFNDPFFRRFFGDRFDPHGRQKHYKTSALGSGVIVSQDGYILTNNHVVKDVDEIKVILQDKREFTGKIVGTDPQTDLAIVKIKASGLPSIKMGDSNQLRVGEIIIAVGNPFGLGNTITMGIVSAVGRSHVGIADYEDFIQTDAAINPGNSGGALVNIHGELVGINTAIFSTSGGNVGIGFAIPSSMAQSVMESIIKHGKVVRGWLGVSIQDLTPELSKHFEIKQAKGTLIADVVKDSPAEKAGLKRGDLIIALNGEAVDDATSLRNVVAATLPGKTVHLKIIRDGKEKTMEVKLGELPAAMASRQSGYETVLSGVYVQDITPEIRSSLGIPQDVSGVIITNIENDSLAAEELRQRDVIQEVNKQTVRTAKDYSNVVSRIKADENVLLLVYRGGGYIYVTINP